MDTTILSAMAGVVGSLVGGSATVATAWITQRTLNRRRLVAAEIRNRQNLYGEFINECSARALDSFENTLDKSERLLSIYALLNRIRICASDTVLSEAERALASITEQYFSPNLSLEQFHALVRDGARSDPLRSFAGIHWFARNCFLKRPPPGGSHPAVEAAAFQTIDQRDPTLLAVSGAGSSSPFSMAASIEGRPVIWLNT
jgi:hypothetical protein